MRLELYYSTNHLENGFSEKFTLKEALQAQKELLVLHIKTRIISEATYRKYQKQLKERYEKDMDLSKFEEKINQIVDDLTEKSRD